MNKPFGKFWEDAPHSTSGGVSGKFLLTTDTGQTQCSSGASGSSTMASCPQTITGQDGDSANVPRARSFTGPTQHATYTADYTTTDNVNGIVWKSCSEGLSGAACVTGTATTYARDNSGVDDASNACSALNIANSGSGYAGLTNWQLPTIQELKILLNYYGTNPFIDAANFPATTTGNYWSASTYAPAALTDAWYIYFGGGIVKNTAKTSGLNVRCVSRVTFDTLTYTDNGDGTISDSVNNLVFQKCSMGQSNVLTCSGAATTATWLNALSYCGGLSLAGRTWRLPSVNELGSLVSLTASSAPLIDTTLFPNTNPNYYWTSTTADVVANAWYVSYSDGLVSNTVKSSSMNYTRCVASVP